MKRSRPIGESGATHPLETLLELIAEDRGDSEDEERVEAWARALRKRVDTRLAALRRQLVSARPLPRRAALISDEILALDREALLARLANLRQAPDVQFAHMELSGLTEDDLRQLVAEIEATERTLT